MRGALVELLDPDNFEQFGSYTPDDTAAIFEDAIAASIAWIPC